jgi:succinate dehydrogenase / fumarate reductase cytochrome b subunit
MDLGIGESLQGGITAARITFAVAAVLIVLAGVWVW